ncbi:hypothetical protein QJS10_CPB12g01470 [Acorus calamus]|uniref:Uncharacterized protein n=1 Tax=Acorus calamus TaxID=4465 RepID=A0AAV9DKP9_ACOCL|nr:hypothetical protein QJS10_CPB12g01470 [Acorus calamus]
MSSTTTPPSMVPHGLRQCPFHAPESPAADRNPRCAVSNLLNTTTAKERLEGQIIARRSVSDLSFAATSTRRLTFEEPTESWRRSQRVLAASGAGPSEGEATQSAGGDACGGESPPPPSPPPATLTSHQPSATPPRIGVSPREPHRTAGTGRSGSPRISGGNGWGFSSENSSLHQRVVRHLKGWL